MRFTAGCAISATVKVKQKSSAQSKFKFEPRPSEAVKNSAKRLQDARQGAMRAKKTSTLFLCALRAFA
jgi:hypothetical protein